VQTNDMTAHCLKMNFDQTNSFIENAIEAGILLGGNGILHAIMVARAVARVTLAADQLLIICDHLLFRSYSLSH